MSEGTLFGLIHDLKDRKRAARIREAQKNYFDDPEGSLRAVAELDLPTAMDMREHGQTFRTNELTNQKTEAGLGDDQAGRSLSALRNVAQGLSRVREGGGDVMGAFDRLTPVFRNGFQMSQQEIAEWRTAIEANPTMIDELAAMTTPAPEPGKPMNVGPGSAIVQPDGKVIFRNPALPRGVTLKDGDGGQELYVYDENGNIIGGGMGRGPSAGPAGNTNPSAQPVGQTRGLRNRNPGNIKDGPWAQRQPGYAGSDGQFAIFDSPEAGTAAQEKLLGDHYVNGQRSVNDIVLKYLGGAGNPENSPESQRNYIDYVSRQIGIDPNAPVPPEALPQLAQAMREFENAQMRGPIARTTGSSGWRPLTAEEAKERNLDPSRSWQIGMSGANKGKVEPVSNQAPYPKAGKDADGNPRLSMAAHETAVRKLQRVRDEADALLNDPAFDQATGSIQGNLPSIFQSTRDFDDRLDSFVGRVVVGALLEMKQNSPNGATGFGQLNKTEGSWLRDSQGSFRQTSPRTLRRSLSQHKTDAMISIGMTYGVPPAAVKFLLQNPDTAAQFNERFGNGLSTIIMGD